MDGYLLDTSVLVTLLRKGGAREAIVKRLADLAESHISVSVAALAELEVGCSLGNRDRDEARREIREVVHSSGWKVRDFTEHSAAVYGELKARLMIKYNLQGHRSGAKRPEEWRLPDKAGKLGIDEFDLLMVTHALEYRLVLVTKDEMSRIRDGLGEAAADLHLEDWSTSAAPS